MAYAYSNPYAAATSAPRANTFRSQRYQVLFSGLPSDVAEHDLRDILVSNPLSIPPESIKMTRYYTEDRRFSGTVLIEVGNEVDAERIRKQFSGETIDGAFQLSVQHVLQPSQSYPSQTAMTVPVVVQAPTQPRQQQQQASATRSNGSAAAAARVTPQQPKASTSKAAAAKPARTDAAPGLALLSRINKASKPNSEQAALLARQKANMNKPGNQLLNRMAKPHSTSAAAKAKGAKAVAQPAKVTRAKQNANKNNAMDIDPPLAKPAANGKAGGAAAPVSAGKPKVKTQAELDEEMKAWERQRRFAAAQ